MTKEEILNEIMEYDFSQVSEEQIEFQREMIRRENKYNPLDLIRIWWDKK